MAALKLSILMSKSKNILSILQNYMILSYQKWIISLLFDFYQESKSNFMIISEKHSTSNHVDISASNLDWEQRPLVAISDMKTLISRLNNNKCKQMEFFSEQLQSPNPIYYLLLILRRFSTVCLNKLPKYLHNYKCKKSP